MSAKMEKISSSAPRKTLFKGLLDSITQIGSRYKWPFLATIAFLAVTVLILLFEPSSFTFEEKLRNIILVFLNRPINGISFEETPLSSVIAAVAPAFLIGVLFTTTVRFIKDLTGSEFGDIRSWNTARSLNKSLNDQIIVVGLGRVGLNLVQMLYNAGYPVVGIDHEVSQRIYLPIENKTVGWVIFSKFATERVQDLDEEVPAIWSRGDNLHAFEKANISRARAVCIMTDDFDSNLFMLMAIRSNYAHSSIITRVRNDAQRRIFSYGGVDRLVQPKQYGAYEIANLLDAASSSLVKVSGTMNVSDYMELLVNLEETGFKLIRTWRWQGPNRNCSVKMLIEAPSCDELPLEIFPPSLQIESATVCLTRGQERSKD